MTNSPIGAPTHGTPQEEASVAADTTRRTLRPSLTAPLRLRTDEHLESAAKSTPTPRLEHAATYPGTSVEDHRSLSPKAERLPSFRQLSKLAGAGEETPRPVPTYPAPPAAYPAPSPLNAQSPVMLQQQPYPQSQQMSPVVGFGYHPQASPTNVQTDPYYANSPPSATFSAPGHYNNRRTSAPFPGMPVSLPSASSSNESGRSHQSSITEGYSTTQTTPLEAGNPLDPSTRPSLPPIPHMQSQSSMGLAAAAFTCDYPGCTAAPFQTQYLLNSHANVHSSIRPHYCPVEGCPRSEGGRGFKRKNEMIRHGLVHDSPGYMCPFCPDREHKYPRPDNLQRHVRVHHVDKDKDDPMLREILSQRAEGGGRGRRRRTGP